MSTGRVVTLTALGLHGESQGARGPELLQEGVPALCQNLRIGQPDRAHSSRSKRVGAAASSRPSWPAAAIARAASAQPVRGRREPRTTSRPGSACSSTSPGSCAWSRRIFGTRMPRDTVATSWPRGKTRRRARAGTPRSRGSSSPPPHRRALAARGGPRGRDRRGSRSSTRAARPLEDRRGERRAEARPLDREAMRFLLTTCLI